MPDKKSDLLQGTLDLLILQTVSLEPVHGFAIANRIEQVSQDLLRVEHGSLYPALYRLEEQGWIAAEWGCTSSRARDAVSSNASSTTGSESSWASTALSVSRVEIRLDTSKTEQILDDEVRHHIELQTLEYIRAV